MAAQALVRVEKKSLVIAGENNFLTKDDLKKLRDSMSKDSIEYVRDKNEEIGALEVREQELKLRYKTVTAQLKDSPIWRQRERIREAIRAIAEQKKKSIENLRGAVQSGVPREVYNEVFGR